MKTFVKLLLATAAIAAQPAQAAVTVGGFTLDTTVFGAQTGVHSTGTQDPNDTLTGFVNKDGSGVTFSTTTGNLSITGGGEATINGDPKIENLNVAFQKSWDSVTFNFAGTGSVFSLLVNGTALFSGADCCTIETSGQYTVTGAGINNLAFTFSPGISDAKQFRVKGVSAVPEPATWGMMLIGFGAVGSAMRRRRVMKPSFI
ncbi:PEPxxWA-CTERM sorting domain-containing protein [Sphingobium boeckii]|uniref:Ice-binding protein C-terminal domain-containing protein n=1 Tax=Sphingobium boeckii TaxID=1082345 RepID=A0A7W9AIA7_9SPHN|nr:PEPxxWA-CTERM sorting domain-containing protein [Sphingobium boeckii]MBB5686145.1 hypothetical protein [Sphingobium boeckii]